MQSSPSRSRFSLRTVVALACTAAFVAFVIGGVTGIVRNGKQTASSRTKDATAVSSNIDAFEAGTAQGVYIAVNIISVDPIALTVKAQYEFDVSSQYQSTAFPNSAFSYTSTPLFLTVGSDSIKFAANSPLVPTQGTVLISGDVSLYPFDGYSTTGLAISAAVGNASNEVPVYFALFRIANGYRTDVDIVENTGTGAFADQPVEIFVSVNISRGTDIKALAMLIAVGMWVMTLCCCALAAFLAFAQRPVELPHIALSATILFAMPGVRNSMPSAPAIGALIDVTVLIWSMLLVAICLCSHFIRFIIKAHRDSVK
ncbi:hypothetical protein HDU82_003114 [Entophlyctis luteolus]|nr:hypothetical protein HDU82_003114 [Entophlyctis luteolus]